MLDRRPRKRSAQAYPTKDLSFIVDQGGRVRRHKYIRELSEFAAPVIASIVIEALIYVFIITRVGRDDWENISVAVLAMAFVPVATAAVLTGLRRHGSPIMTSVIVTTGIYSVAVSALSALRIPISYQGLAACYPIAIVLMGYANVRFQRSYKARVALAGFAQADVVSREVGGVPILRNPGDELPDIEILLIDPRVHHSPEWSTLLTTCYLRGIEIIPWTNYREVRSGRLDVTSFDISHLSYSSSQLIYARAKRYFDVLAVLLSLPLTLTIAAVVALYLALIDGFPVIFVQVRRGYGGRRFRMYKFRTMYKGVEGGSTRVGDKRIMPGCKLLRKLRFDEIPQLYNILRGDMSLIGPRPVAEYVARESSAVEPKYALRSLVVPGITGWAQVRSGYAATVEEELEKLSYDLYYIKHLSFDLDLLIMLTTVKTVLFGSGAR